MSITPDDTAISVTEWMQLAKVGDEQARFDLWTRYYERLVRLAEKRRGRDVRRMHDAEDIVLEAFAAFFNAFEKGKLDGLENRDGLWRMLIVITDNKARDLERHERRQKRGGGRVRGHSVVEQDDPERDVFAEIPDPTPDFADEFSLACEHLLQKLSDEHRQIALWKLAGFTNKEISQRVGCVEEAVRRKVILIRKLWSEHRL